MTTHKTSNEKLSESTDVPADDPVGTMRRFNDGLKRVIAARKSVSRKKRERKSRSR